MTARAVAAPAVALAALLAGCNLGYYCHLAGGQARLLVHARPVSQVLASAELDSTRHQRLEFTQQVRAYGIRHLGLRGGRAYTRFVDLGGRPVIFSLSACPPDRFAPYQWRFPIAGVVPYKGFFDEDRARAEERALADAGLDVDLRPVAAYSLLGYLPDPVLSTMLELPLEALADLILHELTHGTVYASGQAAYNESLAEFVGSAGSLAFLVHRFGPDDARVQQARAARRDRARFGTFMAGVTAELDSLYGLGLGREAVLAEREAVFARAQDRFRQQRGQYERLDFAGFLSWRVNNARLLTYRLYNTSPGLFDSLLQAGAGDLERVVATARRCGAAPDPWACARASLPQTASRPGCPRRRQVGPRQPIGGRAGARRRRSEPIGPPKLR